ncbi:MAG: histidine kinase, partial [Alistipes sp.]|nr:histidine kinase [Alistipes sp.]
LEINGEAFDHGGQYDHPSDGAVMALQIVFYLLMAFVLLTVMTAGAAHNASVKFYLQRAVYCIVIAVVLCGLMPVERPRSHGLTIMSAIVDRQFIHIVDIMVMKCLFVVGFALLYGRIYQLINQREDIMLENELLKSENLRSRYNTLVGQINPHFLFNSLNSLSALVREGKNDDAVRYIDRLSDTFRYTIRNDADTTTTTLDEELEFVEAYKYLLEVRFAGKLFIDIDVESDRMEWMLPTFSIQPLIENAVKHNAITRARPLRISIRTEGDRLVVSNPVNPKIEPEKGTGIGLVNLANRWNLLTGRDIEITNDGVTFSVALPFIKPATA